MFVCRVKNAIKEFRGSNIFENVTFEVPAGARMALLGRNGVGKTTLLRALMGDLDLDGGAIHRHVPLSEWGWLEQSLQVPAETTMRAFVASGDPKLQTKLEEIESLRRALEALSQSEPTMSERTEQAAAAYALQLEEYARVGGYEWEAAVDTSLQRLGLPRETWDHTYAQLSGGQKTRAQLARLMVRKPQVLVLDEPTNHLDSETLLWLEGWLRAYAGTVLLVTHDRYFMDKVATATIELTRKGSRTYPGGYSAYAAQKELERQTQQSLYEKQERERKALLDAIARYRQWYDKAHAAAGINFALRKAAEKNSTRFLAKERALERLERNKVDRPKDAPSVNISFADAGFEARTLVRVEGATFGYDGQRPVLRDVNVGIGRGDRVAVLGPNGCGKSTLLKGLTGRLLPTEGAVRQHPELRVGYFEQELRDLDLSQTVLDTLLGLPDMTQSSARTVLAGFLFPKEEVYKRVGDLSMGERCRIAFVKLYFSQVNLLVLDEPTNYLDIDTRERIEEALLQYPGALVLVSHDRYLMKKVANRILDVSHRPMKDYDGPYDEYMERKASAQVPVDIGIQNELQQLELQLTQYAAADAETVGLTLAELLGKMRAVRQRIDELKAVGSKLV